MIGFTRLALNLNMTRLNPSLENTSAELLEPVGEEKIQSMARFF
jgi:hypothetical protein